MTLKKKRVIEFLENLVYGRYTVKSLEAALSNHFNEEISLSDITDSKDHDDTSDYNLLFESKNEDTYGFFDIYYLPMRKDGYDGANIFITEISWEFE